MRDLCECVCGGGGEKSHGDGFLEGVWSWIHPGFLRKQKRKKMEKRKIENESVAGHSLPLF